MEVEEEAVEVVVMEAEVEEVEAVTEEAKPVKFEDLPKVVLHTIPMKLDYLMALIHFKILRKINKQK